MTLGLLALNSQTCHRSFVAFHINFKLLLEVSNAVVQDELVEILASEVGVTPRCQYLNDSIFDLEHRNVEGATTEVEYQDTLHQSSHSVHSVGESSSCWLIDYTLAVKSCDFTSVKRSLSLGVVEVGRHRDHCILYGLAGEFFGTFFNVFEDFCLDLLCIELLLLPVLLDDDLGSVLVASDDGERPRFPVLSQLWVHEVPPNDPLCVKYCVFREPGCLVVGGEPN